MEIYCKTCFVYQEWNKQRDCVSCGTHFSGWHILGQLQHKKTDSQIGQVSPAPVLYKKSVN